MKLFMVCTAFIAYFLVETIDETESRYEKESASSRAGKDAAQVATVPATVTDPAANVSTDLIGSARQQGCSVLECPQACPTTTCASFAACVKKRKSI
jgi:hypothetical protein